jgi:DNA-binding SARP family transcriptional activator
MAMLCFSLLGKFSVTVDGVAVTGLESGKVQELLGFLLVYRDRPHAREALAGNLWGECESERSKKYLRQALWQIQSALNRGGGRDNSILEIDTEWVRVRADAPFWLDVAELETAFSRARDVAGKNLGDQDIECVRDAVRLYHGVLLEGSYADWCLIDRERYQHIYLLLLDKLMSACEKRHAIEEGLEYGGRILRVDPAREVTHRRMMVLHLLADDRTGALRQYERCHAELENQLGVTPSTSTARLFAHIRDDLPLDQILADVPARLRAEPAPAAPPSLSEVLHQIHSLNWALTALQQQLEFAGRPTPLEACAPSRGDASAPGKFTA